MNLARVPHYDEGTVFVCCCRCLHDLLNYSARIRKSPNSFAAASKCMKHFMPGVVCMRTWQIYCSKGAPRGGKSSGDFFQFLNLNSPFENENFACVKSCSLLRQGPLTPALLAKFIMRWIKNK